MRGIGSVDRGDGCCFSPEAFASSSAELSICLTSTGGLGVAGNLKVCGIEPEPGLLRDGRTGRPGVLGAVATPACRRPGLSGDVEILGSGDQDERRGEGWVEDLRFKGAAELDSLLEADCTYLPEEGPPLACRRGIICKLAERLCLREVLLDPSKTPV